MRNEETLKQVRKILQIYKNSDTVIRPHFILTGPSGSGKSYTLETLADEYSIPMFEINAAQLTKEGTSGNSLSKALGPLLQYADRPVICFVDEWDKMFISGNSNSDLAHETTNGVQNEFLKILEGKSTSVYGDYGKYVEARCENVLFVFAGAFNGEENIDIERLREFGIKTEFLGRVGLAYALEKLTLDDLERILKDSKLLNHYLKLFPKADRDKVLAHIMGGVREHYDNNTLGARLLSTLTHQYFINGGKVAKEDVDKVVFHQSMELH